MITVDEALAKLFGLVDEKAAETVPLANAHGRVLARDVFATRDQPPFAASAMDGYALRGAAAGKSFDVIGESAAGHGFSGEIGNGQAVRIFTGAPVPSGADRVIIQEDVVRTGTTITLNENLDPQTYIRPSGGDFKAGDALKAPRMLGANELALMAAMNIANVPVTRKPLVVFIATGDELVMPGETPRSDQIIASNTFALAAMARNVGATARVLPIAKDTKDSLKLAFNMAEGADLIVTIGGASVGDHDLIAPVAQELGMDQAFYKIAMRPGKPLMAGTLNGSSMIGLPGNPVSSIVCGHIFMLPVLRKMLGLGAAPAQKLQAVLAEDIEANGKREHYMRATVTDGKITAFGRQDSSLLSILSNANALLVRPVNDPARSAGEHVEYVPLS